MQRHLLTLSGFISKAILQRIGFEKNGGKTGSNQACLFNSAQISLICSSSYDL